jgi:hypothetical protein
MATIVCIEDIPMTMQVGFVGTDGIVLAGDQNILFRYTQDNCTGDFSEVLIDGLASKVLLGKQAAIAWSGWEISEIVAKRLLANEDRLSSDDCSQWAEQVARDTYSKAPDKCGPFRHDSELLIALSRNVNQFYSLEMWGEERCRWLPRRDKAVAGHKTNMAAFYVQRYYAKVPISNLIFLAAHTILSASKISSALKGLEIVTCTANEIKRLPESEIEELIRRSQTLDSQIETLLLRRD